MAEGSYEVNVVIYSLHLYTTTPH